MHTPTHLSLEELNPLAASSERGYVNLIGQLKTDEVLLLSLWSLSDFMGTFDLHTLYVHRRAKHTYVAP